MSRQSIIDNSAIMIGRNKYSQPLRTYAIEPYEDGCYYSDCSSFAIAALKLGGYNINWTNTYGLIVDPSFYTVPVVCINGHIINPELNLKVADIIVWPGHCSMVHHFEGSDVYLQDHGSSTPKICRLYEQETWNDGEIVVRRLLELEDEEEQNDATYKVQSGAFSSKEFAEIHKQSLVDNGFPSFITSKGDLFTVQCGSFAEQENASALADDLRGSGFEAYVWECKEEI